MNATRMSPGSEARIALLRTANPASWREWFCRLYVPVVTLLLVATVGSWLARSVLKASHRIAQAGVVQPDSLEALIKNHLTLQEAKTANDVVGTTRPETGNKFEVLYLGNSQTTEIVNKMPGDMTSAQWLQVFLEREALDDRFVVRLGSLPGMDLPEIFLRLVLAGEQNPRQVDAAVVGVSLEQFRKLGIREEVVEFAREPTIRLRLLSLAQESPDLSRVLKVLDPVVKSAPANNGKQVKDDQELRSKQIDNLVLSVARHWSLFEAREAAQQGFAYGFMNLRNRVFGITTSSARPVPEEMYQSNVELMEMMARYVHGAGIHLILYLAPLRSQEPNPYVPADRARLRDDLVRLCLQYHLTCLDYMDAIPDGYYVNPDPDGQRRGEPEFVHFTAEAHKIVAERLMVDIGPKLSELSRKNHSIPK